MVNIYEEIKSRLNLEIVYSHYTNNSVNRHKSRCVFHDDTKPSMSFKGQLMTCFSGGCISGDIFKFMNKYFNISNYEAAKKLNTDFNLGLNIGGYQHKNNKLAKAAELRRMAEKQQRDKILKEYDNVAERAIQAVRNAETIILINKHTTGSIYDYAETEQFSKFLDGVQLLDRAEYIYNLFACDIIDYKHELYARYGADKSEYLTAIKTGGIKL